MQTCSTAKSLSPSQSRLLVIISGLGYGTIRGLNVQDGDPVFDPPPEITRSVRLTETNTARRSSGLMEFAVKDEHRALLRELTEIGDGVVNVIKVHDGLPVALEIRE